MLKNKPKVSIVIPCYNEINYIERAVNSAYNQDYINKEIIVIDDGSNANTKEILKKLQVRIDKLLIQKNSGVVSARNYGIAEADGEFILTLDADDYFEPRFLKNSVPILEQNSRVGMVTSWMLVKNELSKEKRIVKPTGASAFNALFFNNAPASLLFRKKCWEEVEGYDINLYEGYEDWEFNVAVGEKGWQIFVIREVLFNYTNRIGSRNKKARNFYPKIRRYTYKKHQALLAENIDKTIDFLLNEIENKDREIDKLKNSRSYLLGDLFIKPLRKLKSYFS